MNVDGDPVFVPTHLLKLGDGLVERVYYTAGELYTENDLACLNEHAPDPSYRLVDGIVYCDHMALPSARLKSLEGI